MKQKKVDWFTKNSTILFIVFFALLILSFNWIIAGIRDLRIFFTWDLLFFTILSVLATLVFFLFLWFIIYYEDYQQKRNKRTFRLFEIVIERFLSKGEKNE